MPARRVSEWLPFARGLTGGPLADRPVDLISRLARAYGRQYVFLVWEARTLARNG
ncbi:hypothetical protein Mal15_33770 [Stieleria maiorica]|uniref:Uncharacterized protein n=1 Tax=Stieleria maiorica TaxID=2795974 RepID=A0A5B9MER4_9BACT|nr:hypothetical protein Mal15_33770 [Stieleria maiorica]